MSPTPNTLATTVVAVAGPCEGGSCNVLDLCAKMLTVAFGREVTVGALRQLVPAGERIPHVETAFNWPTGVALIEHPGYHGVRTVYLYDHREKLVVGEPLPSADGIEGALHDVPPGADAGGPGFEKVAELNHGNISGDTMIVLTLPADEPGADPRKVRMTFGEAAALYSLGLHRQAHRHLALGEEVEVQDTQSQAVFTMRVADPDAAAFEGSADGEGSDDLARVREAEAQADAEREHETA